MGIVMNVLNIHCTFQGCCCNIHCTFQGCCCNIHFTLQGCCCNILFTFLGCCCNIHCIFQGCCCNIHFTFQGRCCNIHCTFQGCCCIHCPGLAVCVPGDISGNYSICVLQGLWSFGGRGDHRWRSGTRFLLLLSRQATVIVIFLNYTYEG